MAEYPACTLERAIKAQAVISRLFSKRLTIWQAANILRISTRHLRRTVQRFRARGFERLYDQRLGKASPLRVPLP